MIFTTNTCIRKYMKRVTNISIMRPKWIKCQFPVTLLTLVFVPTVNILRPFWFKLYKSLDFVPIDSMLKVFVDSKTNCSRTTDSAADSALVFTFNRPRGSTCISSICQWKDKSMHFLNIILIKVKAGKVFCYFVLIREGGRRLIDPNTFWKIF